MCGMQWRCGLPDDVQCTTTMSSSMGVQGPCAVAFVASMAGDVALHGSVLKTTLCVMGHVQEVASAAKGVVMHNIDVVSLGGGTMSGS
jgi:hypothetical protein